MVRALGCDADLPAAVVAIERLEVTAREVAEQQHRDACNWHHDQAQFTKDQPPTQVAAALP
jgi:hypothetical protein